MQRLRRIRVGVWLGVIAVAFYAWLPGHFAGHVARTALDARAALGRAHGESASHRHAHHPASHDEHHGGTCPICAAAAASAAPAAAMLPALAPQLPPPSIARPNGIAQATAVLGDTPLTPYAPRGPPPAA